MRFLSGLALLGFAAAVAPSASAHHSPVMFDQAKKLTIEGTVRQFQWTNPHCYIQLVDGAGTEWSMEMGAPIYLMNRGWKKSTLQPGDRIRITGAPLRSGAKGGLVLSVESLDGKTIGKVK